MPASPEQRDHAVERAAKIFGILKASAEAGEVCPTNAFFCTRFSCGVQTIVSAFEFLEANGMIEVERFARSRIVTICATGKRTAGEVKAAHWSAGSRRRAA